MSHICARITSSGNTNIGKSPLSLYILGYGPYLLMESWYIAFACGLFSFIVGVKRPFSTLNASSTSVTAETCTMPTCELAEDRSICHIA